MITFHPQKLGKNLICSMIIKCFLTIISYFKSQNNSNENDNGEENAKYTCREITFKIEIQRPRLEHMECHFQMRISSVINPQISGGNGVWGAHLTFKRACSRIKSLPWKERSHMLNCTSFSNSPHPTPRQATKCLFLGRKKNERKI